MYESLQNLKSPQTADQTRANMNKTRDEILENAFRRGLPQEAQFEISPAFKDDMAQGWNHGGMTSADAFTTTTPTSRAIRIILRTTWPG